MKRSLVGYLISLLVSIVLFLDPKLIFAMSDGIDVIDGAYKVVFLIFSLVLFSIIVEKNLE